MKKWYKVVCEESFYNDMVGEEVEKVGDKCIKLCFNNGNLGTVIFYKDQVQFESEG